jgi:hypothetical protein
MDLVDKRELWGAGLRTWPAALVDTLGLAPEDAAYLKEVGLPDVPGAAFAFAPSEPVPRRHASKPVLGQLYAAVLLLDGGRVYTLDHNDDLVLVNTSVRRFGRFLVHHERYQLDMERLPEDDEAGALALVDQAEAAMRADDPEALAQEHYLWAEIVEQMREGNL